MITYEVFHLNSIYPILVSTLIALLWSLYTINRGRGWNITIVRNDGTSSQRFDWTLVQDIGIKILTFAGRLFFIVNIIGFSIFNKWVFGKEFGFGGNIVVVLLLLSDGIKSLYDWTKDESEKRDIILKR